MGETDVRVIMLNNQEIRLDPANMKFNETTLNDYMEKEAGWYDYFGAMLADAEYLEGRRHEAYERIYSEKFDLAKSEGCSDKLADASAKKDEDVKNAKLEALEAKHKVKLLQQHLRAWDRAHENAQSRGHYLRKEIDKLSKDIHYRPDNYYERQLESIVKEVDITDVAKELGESL